MAAYEQCKNGFTHQASVLHWKPLIDMCITYAYTVLFFLYHDAVSIELYSAGVNDQEPANLASGYF